MLVTRAIIIIVGTAFIIYRIQNIPIPPPENHLEPYLTDTTDLNLIIMGENIEIRVVFVILTIFYPHNDLPSLSCHVRLNVTNTSNETINDCKAIMGTAFDSENEVIYSFWISMVVDSHMVEKIAIPPKNTTLVSCTSVNAFAISDTNRFPTHGYVRVQLRFNTNFTAIATSPLTEFGFAIE
ncbi:hypothetical protein E4H12_07170 [Candidatus Thorarchaeota archaeon]|nr:MAG: hypothetical protein E4H12_07170 [Candidatus Thorarchaeota archaeon]